MIKELDELINRPKSNKLYQVYNNILVLRYNNVDLVATPWDSKETTEWYKKETLEEDTSIEYVDIEKEGIWVSISDEDDEYEYLSYLFYIDGFVELVRGNPNNKFDNITILDGELAKFITIKQYCDTYLKNGNLMKQPEIIASSEF